MNEASNPWYSPEVFHSRSKYALKKIDLISGNLHVKQATHPSPLKDGKVLAIELIPRSTGPETDIRHCKVSIGFTSPGNISDQDTPPPMNDFPVRLLSVACRIFANCLKRTGTLMKTKMSAAASGPLKHVRATHSRSSSHVSVHQHIL